MEISNFRTSAEFMGMDDHDSFFYNQCPMNSIFNELECASLASSFVEDQQYQSYSKPRVLDFKRPIESTPFEANAPLKRPKQQNNWSSCFPNQMEVVKVEEEIIWSPSSIINFPSESPLGSHGIVPKTNYQGVAKVGQSREHVLAERKRREKLAKRFVNLSVLVPGLKKMDKATILEQAIKHMKELQEKVKILEDQKNKNATESVVFVKKYDTNSSATGDSVSNNGPTKLPEIDAKFCNNEVLISIHCEKRKGMLEKTVAEIEKLNLLVVNSSVMSFGDSALNVTVIAKMDDKFVMNMKEVTKRLHTALD